MNLRSLLTVVLALAAWSTRLHAFVYIEDLPAWPNGNVTLELQLGASPTYSDGTTPNSTAIQALQSWNPSMSRVQLNYVNNSGAAKSRTNGKNNVFFSANVFGSPFGDGVLAVTVGRARASGPIEMDVVVNTAESWDSYRGPLQYPKIDLRRVLAHEFGHVLGLGHPDEVGQWVTALMNSHVSDIDTVQQDDKDGASARYGRGPGNPATPPSIWQHPSGGTVTEGHTLTLSSAAVGSEPITQQWLKDDVPIAGATNTWIQFSPVRMGDAGTYQIRFTNDGGSVTSNEAILTVVPATPPVFQSNPPASQTVEEGNTLYLTAWATSNTAIHYQWTRDGSDVPGATSTFLSLYAITPAHAGAYRLVATNIAGTATSSECVVTVTPPKPPIITSHPSDLTVVVGQSCTLHCGAYSTLAMTYQWSRDGVPIPGANLPYYAIDSATAADAGSYRATVTNLGGSTDTHAATLTVIPVSIPPEITLRNVTAPVGHFLALSFYTPWPSDGTTYQWYKDSAAIPGATHPYFYVDPVAPTHAGEYFVVATNSAGSTTSTTAQVTVLESGNAPADQWRQAMTAGGVTYFLFENPARIERFDLTIDAWLGTIQLPRVPTTMAIAEDGAPIIAFHRTISRIDAATGAETHLVTFDQDARELAVSGDRLFILADAPSAGWGSRKLGSIALDSPGTPQWSAPSYSIGSGLSIDAVHGKAFTVSSTISPATIASTVINADGSFGATSGSPYHGSFFSGLSTTVSPDAARIFASSGVVYSTIDLTYVGAIGSRFNAIAFQADGSPLVVRDALVSAYDLHLRRRGVIPLTRPAHHLAVLGDAVFAFSQPMNSGAAVAWEKHALSSLAEPPALEPISASGLSYTADDVFMDRDGVVVLYSKIHGNLFRWSSREQRYLAPIPLRGRPNYILYSAETHRIHLGYADNRISMIDLTSGTDERHFSYSPGEIQRMGTAGEYVMVCAQVGTEISYLTFNAQGTLASSSAWCPNSRTYVWNASRRRLYHFRDDSSPNDLLYTEFGTNGAIGTTMDSPYHGEIELQPPIRISPSGDMVLLGTGKFYNADTLAQNNELPNALLDATWLGTRLVTMRDTLDGAQLQRWGGANYGLDATRVLGGRTIRLFACGPDRLLAVTQKGGRIQFTLLDSDLVVRNHIDATPDLTSATLANLSTRAIVGTGDEIMVAGFVVTGDGPKRLLVRGIGPGLDQFGVGGTLADPVLHLVRLDGSPIAINDDWASNGIEEMRDAFHVAGAFAIDESSTDAALVVELPPGPYTAQIHGKSGATGVALVETYDLEADAGARRLVNISTRARVGTGSSILIPGLVIDGTTTKRLLVRAIGPTLTAMGVSGALADPRLELINAAHEVVVSNNDWGSDNVEAINAAAAAAGAFALPAGSRDAALVVTLPPGSYTVAVSGVGDTSGIALVEVYEVP